MSRPALRDVSSQQNRAASSLTNKSHGLTSSLLSKPQTPDGVKIIAIPTGKENVSKEPENRSRKRNIKLQMEEPKRVKLEAPKDTSAVTNAPKDTSAVTNAPSTSSPKPSAHDSVVQLHDQVWELTNNMLIDESYMLSLQHLLRSAIETNLQLESENKILRERQAQLEQQCDSYLGSWKHANLMNKVLQASLDSYEQHPRSAPRPSTDTLDRDHFDVLDMKKQFQKILEERDAQIDGLSRDNSQLNIKIRDLRTQYCHQLAKDATDRYHAAVQSEEHRRRFTNLVSLNLHDTNNQYLDRIKELEQQVANYSQQIAKSQSIDSQNKS